MAEGFSSGFSNAEELDRLKIVAVWTQFFLKNKSSTAVAAVEKMSKFYEYQDDKKNLYLGRVKNDEILSMGDEATDNGESSLPSIIKDPSVIEDVLKNLLPIATKLQSIYADIDSQHYRVPRYKYDLYEDRGLGSVFAERVINDILFASFELNNALLSFLKNPEIDREEKIARVDKIERSVEDFVTRFEEYKRDRKARGISDEEIPLIRAIVHNVSTLLGRAVMVTVHNAKKVARDGVSRDG